MLNSINIFPKNIFLCFSSFNMCSIAYMKTLVIENPPHLLFLQSSLYYKPCQNDSCWSYKCSIWFRWAKNGNFYLDTQVGHLWRPRFFGMLERDPLGRENKRICTCTATPHQLTTHSRYWPVLCCFLRLHWVLGKYTRTELLPVVYKRRWFC